MKFTREEKEIYAQQQFESCFRNNGFFISGINNTYQIVNESEKNIYQTGMDKQFKDYYILDKFNGEDLSIYPKETKIKLINITKNIFEQMGYVVDTIKVLKNN